MPSLLERLVFHKVAYGVAIHLRSRKPELTTLKTFVCVAAPKGSLINYVRASRNADLNPKPSSRGFQLLDDYTPLQEAIRVHHVEFEKGLSNTEENNISAKIYACIHPEAADEMTKPKKEGGLLNPEDPNVVIVYPKAFGLWRIPSDGAVLKEIEKIDGVACVEEGQVIDGEET